MHFHALLFFSNLFSSDMLVILLFALVLFGGDKLPEIARGIGKGLREFKEASDGVKREINNQIYSYEEKKQEKKYEENVARNNEYTSSTGTDGWSPVANTTPVGNTSFVETTTTADTDGEAEAPNKTETVKSERIRV